MSDITVPLARGIAIGIGGAALMDAWAPCQPRGPRWGSGGSTPVGDGAPAETLLPSEHEEHH